MRPVLEVADIFRRHGDAFRTAQGNCLSQAQRRVGPALVFERLWEETGCRAVIAELVGKRKHGFALERAVFLTVLHRLFVSVSDRAADRWREDYAINDHAIADLAALRPWRWAAERGHRKLAA